MEALERHLLHVMLNGEVIEVEKKYSKNFSLEFTKQYNLIKRMATQNMPLTKINLETYAIMEEQSIDIDYAKSSEYFKKINIHDAIKLQVQAANHQKSVEKMSSLVERYKLGDKSAGLELQKELSHSIGATSNGEVVSIGQYFTEQIDFLESILNKEALEGLILWGHKKKNSKQFMGLSNIIKRISLTDLVMIGARPSVGKTSFALALMNALYKNNYKPLFISLEMSNGELLQRLATAKSGLSYDLLISPETELTQEQIKNYQNGLLEASKMDLKVIDRPPTSWLEMKQLIINHKDEIDYVILDHMHIISTYDGTPSQNKNQMYGEISRDMKLFARDYKIPIIVLAQLNREVRAQKGKGGTRIDPTYVEPFATDLRDSGSLEQDADKIIMLYREKPENHENNVKYGMFPIVCKVEKNRSGKLGVVKYLFNAKTGRWSENYSKEGEDDIV